MIGPHWKINKFEGKNITKSMPGTMVVQTQKKKQTGRIGRADCNLKEEICRIQ